LTQNGVMDKNALFEAPFTDLHMHGLNGLFSNDQIGDLLTRLERINSIIEPEQGSSPSGPS
jgi:hypothetical protein